MASTIWSPMRYTGLSDVMGSWKIMAMSLPRISRYSFSESVVRSLPSNSIEPPATWPGSARRPIIDRLVTDLPEPDSPTMARISPSSTENVTSSTARTTPRLTGNSVQRFFTSSNM